MSRPVLIDMPEPPSNPETPSEMPGTPNSTTTSLSALSTTAIKDGHRGSAQANAAHSSHLSTNVVEAERADRISRLAGLERVSTLQRSSQSDPNDAEHHAHDNGGAGTTPTNTQIPGYFDASGNPVYTTKMSTVGSASATGSLGGGRSTTWASGSMGGDGDDGTEEDKMSMDTNFRDQEHDDRDRDSGIGESERIGSDDGDRMSDGNASLVGFGEGASSTVSGPTSSRGLRAVGGGAGAGAGAGAGTGTGTNIGAATGVSSADGRDASLAEKIVRERLDQGEGQPVMSTPNQENLGRFYFEEKK